MSRCNARKKLWFLFRKNGQLVRVFIQKPKKVQTYEPFGCVENNLWQQANDKYMRYEGDSLQCWILVGRKYEFAREY